MTIMDIIRKFTGKNNEKSEKFKEMEEDYMLKRKLEERMKSANRRELERHIKEQEEKEIKEQLDKIRKQRTQEVWKGNYSILNSQKNILKTEKPMSKDKTFLKSNRPIAKQKNMFLQRHSGMMSSGGFSKW